MKDLLKVFLFSLILCVVTTPFEVFAQDSTVFDESIEKGKTAYQTGDYNTAIEEFIKAYQFRPTPSLLYNIARSYDASGDLDHAEDYYSRFIKAPGVSPSARADAVERLKTVRDIQALNTEEKRREEEKKKAEEEKKKAKTKPVVKLNPKTDPVVEGSASAWSWVLMGLGVVTIGGGIATGIHSQIAYDDMKKRGYPNSIDKKDLEEVKALQKDGESLKMSSIALMAGGSALFVGGIITYFVTKPSGDETSWNVQPVLSPHIAGLQLTTTW